MNIINPKVSVVIPCYNDKDYINETVQAVLDQTFQDFDIVIVDDGSNQETKNVLATIKNEKVTIINQENKGLSAARNTGFKVAKGVYVLAIDSDDTLDVSFLEKAVVILDKNEKIGAVSSHCTIFVGNHKIIDYHKPKGGGVSNFLFDNNSVSFALIRKSSWEIVGGYDEKMINGFEDWEFWIAMTKTGLEVYTIPEFLFHYRQKEISMSKDSKMNFRESNLNYIYKKHSDIYSKYFDDVIDVFSELAQRHKKNEIKYKKSLEFKTGRIVLFPLRWLKKTIKNKWSI